MNEIKAKLRKLRMIQLLLIAGVLIFASLPEHNFARPSSPRSWHFWLIIVLNTVCLLEGFNFRYRFLPRAVAALAREPESPRALRRWEVWQLTCLVTAATVALYGLVWRTVLRGTLREALVFYSVGLILLLLWTPRCPVATAQIQKGPARSS